MPMVQGQPGERVPDQSGIYNKTLSKTQINSWKMILRGRGKASPADRRGRSPWVCEPLCSSQCFRTPVPDAPDPAHTVTSQSVHAWYFSLAFPKSQIAKNLSNILIWSWHLESWKHSKTIWWYAWTLWMFYMPLSWGPEDGLEGEILWSLYLLVHFLQSFFSNSKLNNWQPYRDLHGDSVPIPFPS